MKWAKIFISLFLILVIPATVFSRAAHLPPLPEQTRGIYLPPRHVGLKRLKETIHYYSLSGLNAVVLHVKEPRGRLAWNASNETARQTGAVYPGDSLKRAVRFFKEKGIRTIAKLDVFIDSRLAEKIPEYGILDIRSGTLWSDRNGLKWVNPYDRRVWKYNIDLGRELARMGFDEIQFDYARFPSDGVLKNMQYPLVIQGVDRVDCMELFFKYAWEELKPLGVDLSVALFGLTAWKRDDFGIGQVLEKITPFVDIICPMLYPSHFPKDFLGWENPAKHPHRIVELSMNRLLKRSSKPIRPWLQAFSYPPAQINFQIDGVEKSGPQSWMVWNASANYENFYAALERRSGRNFPEPRFYPDLEALRLKEENIIKGRFRIINYTDYKRGLTVISLEESTANYRSPYNSPLSVISTMDEAILDRIMKHRGIRFSRLTRRYLKSLKVALIFSREIETTPDKVLPGPVYIDWLNHGSFSKKVPKELKKRIDLLHKSY